MGYPLRFAILFMLLALWSANAASAENANLVATTWLDRLNFYRATAALPPVVEEAALSGPVAQHARYMVAHDVIQHSQNSRRSWWTPEGAVAATVSNLAGSLNPNEPDWWAVDLWMQAPFHAIGILDPALQRVGFGIYRQHDGRKIQTAAGLDVIRGRGNKPAHVTYPIVWPADGASVPIGTHTSEYPSPLSSCPGYKAPTGTPADSAARRRRGDPPRHTNDDLRWCAIARSTAPSMKARIATGTTSSRRSAEASLLLATPLS